MQIRTYQLHAHWTDEMSEDVTQNHAQCIKIFKFKHLAVQNFERQNRGLIFSQCGGQFEHHEKLRRQRRGCVEA